MSEEILHALMELFAIIIKQDGGVTEQEKAYVRRFLASQIGEEGGDEYYRFFLDVATADQEEGQKLTSVLDSVKVLKIGKKINQTLNQKQKIILIVRALELINTEYALTRQRLEIVKTLSDFFRISAAEYESIFQFVTSGQDSELNDPNLLLLGGEPVPEPVKSIPATGLDRPAVILRVPAVNLYFLHYPGALDVYLNGNIINKNTIYLLARGSSIRLPVGAPVYYSDIAARFLSETMDTRIVFEARDIEYTFPGNVKGLQDIRFTAVEGSLVGIMGSS